MTQRTTTNSGAKRWRRVWPRQNAGATRSGERRRGFLASMMVRGSRCRDGSAYLVVICVIGVLLILVVNYLKSNVNRHYSTRHMSNEKKAEALAEAAVNLLVDYFKERASADAPERMNDSADPTVYPFLRQAGAGNSISFSGTTAPLNRLAGVITEMGGAANVDLTVDCTVVDPQAFTPKTAGYQVVGLDTPAHTMPGAAHSLTDLSSTYQLEFDLANQPATHDEHDVDVPLGLNGKVEIDKLDKAKFKVHVKVEDPIFGGDVFDETWTFDIYEDAIKTYIDIPGGMTMEAVRNCIMPGANSALSKPYPSAGPPLNTTPGVEKDALVRFRATVQYRPNGPGGMEIKRVLAAERELKVCDVQPIAPDHTFFVANSTLLNDVAPGPAVGNIVDWIGGAEALVIHNCPGGNYTNVSATNWPGAIRINCDSTMKIYTFLGTLDNPMLNEFNAILVDNHLTDSRGKTFKMRPTFQWRDRNPKHKFQFPVVSHNELNNQRYHTFESLKTLISFCDVIDAPTLLTGRGHLEYPLGMRVEAPLDMVYSEIGVQVEPKGDLSGDDSNIWIDYHHKESEFGLPNLGSNRGSGWGTNNWQNMPPYLYSTVQYAKKAAFFYDSEALFWADVNKPIADGGRKLSSGEFDCSGVTYIKGSLNINNPLTVKGEGVIVARENIVVKANVTRAAGGILTLVARNGAMVFQGASEVQASCYSHQAPQNGAGSNLKIVGNLVMNQFIRDRLDNVEVFYDGPALRASAEKRYHAAVGARWARFEYEKL